MNIDDWGNSAQPGKTAQQTEGSDHGAPDLASRLTPDHHQSLKLWLRMLSCTVRIENEIRTRLRNTFDITLPRFDLMAQLERYPDGLRMGELSRRMMVTGGNITGITDQLEREQLVVRVPDSADRRAFAVKLTDSGRAAFAAMAEVHEGWVADLLRDVSPDEKCQLITLLHSVKENLNISDRADDSADDSADSKADAKASVKKE